MPEEKNWWEAGQIAPLPFSHSTTGVRVTRLHCLCERCGDPARIIATEVREAGPCIDTKTAGVCERGCTPEVSVVRVRFYAHGYAVALSDGKWTQHEWKLAGWKVLLTDMIVPWTASLAVSHTSWNILGGRVDTGTAFAVGITSQLVAWYLSKKILKWACPNLFKP